MRRLFHRLTHARSRDPFTEPNVRTRRYIDDLAAPRQTDAAVAAMEAAKAHPVTLTRDAVLDEARRATGLSDFGEMDFLDRLDTMLRSAEEDGLNAFIDEAEEYGSR